MQPARAEKLAGCLAAIWAGALLLFLHAAMQQLLLKLGFAYLVGILHFGERHVVVAEGSVPDHSLVPNFDQQARVHVIGLAASKNRNKLIYARDQNHLVHVKSEKRRPGNRRSREAGGKIATGGRKMV